MPEAAPLVRAPRSHRPSMPESHRRASLSRQSRGRNPRPRRFVSVTVIARIWHGWTEPGENADAYEQLLRAHVLPGIHRVAGFRGAYLLREDGPDEAEFVTVTLFDSLDDVREFAGDDYEAA